MQGEQISAAQGVGALYAGRRNPGLQLSVMMVGAGLESGFFFFFQAEDGIRDYKVTGVQTCALPIWSRSQVQRRFFAHRFYYWRRQREAGEQCLPPIRRANRPASQPRRQLAGLSRRGDRKSVV